MDLSFLGLFIIMFSAFHLMAIGGLHAQTLALTITALQFAVGVGCIVAHLRQPLGTPEHRDDFRLYWAGILAVPAALSIWAILLHPANEGAWLVGIVFFGATCLSLWAHLAKLST